MKNDEASDLRRRGNQKVRDLAVFLSSGREKALNLPGSVKMVGGRFHKLERLECLHQVVPLCDVPCRVSDLKVAYGGSSKFASFQARLDGASNFGSFETRDNARVHQVRQRHASSRSTRSARARTSRDFLTAARRCSAARRRASFTVSLMVWVPSPTRAASNACSSMSTRRFVMRSVYMRVQEIYLATSGGSKLTIWICGVPTTGLPWKLMPSTPARPIGTGARDRSGQRSLRRLAPRRSSCTLMPRDRYGPKWVRWQG